MDFKGDNVVISNIKLERLLSMKGGKGENSYANNSQAQVWLTSLILVISISFSPDHLSRHVTPSCVVNRIFLSLQDLRKQDRSSSPLSSTKSELLATKFHLVRELDRFPCTSIHQILINA